MIRPDGSAILRLSIIVSGGCMEFHNSFCLRLLTFSVSFICNIHT